MSEGFSALDQKARGVESISGWDCQESDTNGELWSRAGDQIDPKGAEQIPHTTDPVNYLNGIRTIRQTSSRRHVEVNSGKSRLIQPHDIYDQHKILSNRSIFVSCVWGRDEKVLGMLLSGLHGISNSSEFLADTAKLDTLLPTEQPIHVPLLNPLLLYHLNKPQKYQKSTWEQPHDSLAVNFPIVIFFSRWKTLIHCNCAAFSSNELEVKRKDANKCERISFAKSFLGDNHT